MNSPNVGAMVRRLLHIYDGAPAELRAAGLSWYPHAWATARALGARYGVPADRAAGVIAALSPRIGWNQNVRAAESLLADPATGGAPAFGANRAIARAVLAEGPDAIKGPKTGAFFRAITGDSDAVTLDRWAIGAATGDHARESIDRMAHSAAWRPAIDRAYRLAAEHRGVSPRDFQAVVWTAIRGRPFGNGPTTNVYNNRRVAA